MATNDVTAKAFGGMVPAPKFGDVAPAVDFGVTKKYEDVPIRAFGEEAGAGGPGADQNLAIRTAAPATLAIGNGDPEPLQTPPAPTTPPTVPPPPAAGGPTSTVPPNTVDEAHRKFHSIGDPHVRMGNEYFDNTRVGDFVMLQTADKSFQVQNRQEKFADGSVANTAGAVKDGDNVVTYDVKTKKLLVNGQEWDGKTQPPGGTKIEKIGDGYKVTTSKGDVVNFHDKGHYLDIDGEIGPNRQVGEVRGEHGVFDNTDGIESHQKRDGTQARDVNEMIEDWRVKPEEDLFKAAGKGGPGAETKIDDATKKALVDLYDQLTKLTKSLGDLLGKLGIDVTGGKGGPAPAEAKPAQPAPAPAPAEPRPADGKGGAAPVNPNAPTPGANEVFGEILKALKGLMDLLTKLLAQLQGGAAPAPQPVPVEPARPQEPAKPAAPGLTPAPLGELPKVA